MLLLLHIAKNAKINSDSDCDKTVKKSLSKDLNRVASYLSPNAKQAFIQLKQAFIQAPILRHFDLKCHIQIKTDVSGYAIGRVLS